MASYKANRRTLLAGGFGLGAAVTLSKPSRAESSGTFVKIRRYDQIQPFPVNAYIVEGTDGLVLVDATLTATSAARLRAEILSIGKPLQAILLTHPHPDHYAGLGIVSAGLDVPIFSVAGVRDVVQRDDAGKDALIGGMFGSEWPSSRVFPTDIVKDGDRLNFGSGLDFEVRDIGPAESLHDSIFIMPTDTPQVFAGDLAYGYMHPYMADNTNPEWLAALEAMQRDLPEGAVLHVGHGLPVTPAFLTWQADYIRFFEEQLSLQDWSDAAAASDAVVARMFDRLPTEDLVFLMQLSIAPNVKRLGLL